jgi:hypothetical protein
MTQRGDESARLRVAMGYGGHEPLPAAGPTMASAMFVVAQVSSMNTKCSGLSAGCRCGHPARAAATSGRSCSASCRVFFSPQCLVLEEEPERRAAGPDAAYHEP